MDGQTKDRTNVKGRRRLRKWPWVVGGILAFILLFLLVAPALVSSRGVTRMILARINRSTGGTADVGDLSVG